MRATELIAALLRLQGLDVLTHNTISPNESATIVEFLSSNRRRNADGLEDFIDENYKIIVRAGSNTNDVLTKAQKVERIISIHPDVSSIDLDELDQAIDGEPKTFRVVSIEQLNSSGIKPQMQNPNLLEWSTVLRIVATIEGYFGESSSSSSSSSSASVSSSSSSSSSSASVSSS